jgi:alpha-L-fucosidase
MKILKYEIPDELIMEYNKWKAKAEMYLVGKQENTLISIDERDLRWNICILKQMEIYIKICKYLNIEHNYKLIEELLKELEK